MKFLHMADLHIGRRLGEYSLEEDQKYILNEILNIIDEEKPDGVIIAGDVYDKQTPSAQAVSMLDSFLCELSKRQAETFIISGNHDSAERIAYGERLFEKNGIHISPVFDKSMTSVELSDEYGKITVYLMPFVKTAHVKRAFPDADIDSYSDALKTVIEAANVDQKRRNIIVAHQFVTGAQKSESEDISVGTLDNVDCEVFSCFDYVALGHIHRAQKVGRECVRYSGTPLKYSASEAGHRKSVTIIELKQKGEVLVTTRELRPLRDFKVLKGTLEELLLKGSDDYVKVILTDRGAVSDAFAKLSVKYPFITEIIFEKDTTNVNFELAKRTEESHLEQFKTFYSLVNSQPLTDEQIELVKELFEEAQR